jgi:hypothetical protein
MALEFPVLEIEIFNPETPIIVEMIIKTHPKLKT